jgi:hypothetical protein
LPGRLPFILSDLTPIGDAESFLHPQQHLIVRVETESLPSAQALRANPVTCPPAITADRFKRAGEEPRRRTGAAVAQSAAQPLAGD